MASLGIMEGPINASDTITVLYRIEVFKGGPQLGRHYASQTAICVVFSSRPGDLIRKLLTLFVTGNAGLCAISPRESFLGTPWALPV